MKKANTNTETNSPQNGSAGNQYSGNETVTTVQTEEEFDAEDFEDSEVTNEEIELLDASEENSGAGDDAALSPRLDNTDEDGDPLEEKGFADDVTGEDLDVPGSEDDDDNEELGEEDEENNNYSQADTD